MPEQKFRFVASLAGPIGIRAWKVRLYLALFYGARKIPLKLKRYQYETQPLVTVSFAATIEDVVCKLVTPLLSRTN
jgi:hypothetical protein